MADDATAATPTLETVIPSAEITGETPPAEQSPPPEAQPAEAAPKLAPLSGDALATVLEVMKLDGLHSLLLAEQLYADRIRVKAGSTAGTLNEVGQDTVYKFAALLGASSLRKQVKELSGAEPSADLIDAITADIDAKRQKKIIGSAGALSPERVAKKLGEFKDAVFKEVFQGWEKIPLSKLWTGEQASIATQILGLHLSETDPTKLAPMANEVATLLQKGFTLQENFDKAGTALTAAEAAWKSIAKDQDPAVFIKALGDARDTADKAVTDAQPEGTVLDKAAQRKLEPLRAKAGKAKSAFETAERIKAELDRAKSAKEQADRAAETFGPFFRIFATTAQSALDNHCKRKGYSVPTRNHNMQKYNLAERWALLGQKATGIVAAESAKNAAATPKSTATAGTVEPAIVVVKSAKPSVGDLALTVVGRGWLWGRSK